MTRPGFATRQDLLRWADTVPSRTVLPRLVRRLILETGSNVTALDFPAGEGVAAGGWDGVARARAETTYVANGLSLWELSVNTGANAKAEDDYTKRLDTPDGSPTTDAIYCQLILRPWTDRSTFSKDKSAEGRWKEVRAYGVDDVEAWLESASVTHAWISEQLGLEPYGMRTVDSWWNAWAIATTPALTVGIVLAGRAETAGGFRATLKGSPQITTVLADSRDESLAFVAAVLLAADNDGDGELLARTAFVDDVGTWRVLADQTHPLILVARTPEVIAEATSAPKHHVIVPLSTGRRADVVIPPLDADEVVSILGGLNLEDRKADDAGRLARRSLLALRRHLANKPELHVPRWAQPPVERMLRGILLGSQWSESEGDQSIMADLTGLAVDALGDRFAALASEEDPVIDVVNRTWALISAYDAWLLLQEHLRIDDLRRFHAASKDVLLELDPLAGLDETERLKAQFEGKSRRYSGDLRQGLATSLALLGVHGEDLDLGGGADGSGWAAAIVRDLFAAANADADGELWAAMASSLPLLAEASPDEFLSAVRTGTQGDEPVLKRIFRDETDAGLFGSHSPHSYLLWAMESVAWSTDHFGAAVDLLARLDEVDPGGRLSNRPFQSLTSIFCPWHPDNSSSWEGRLAAIEGLRSRHPDTAWRLMLRLLPDFQGVHDPTHEPRYRDWKSAVQGGWSADSVAFTERLAEWLREDAGNHVGRWVELIEQGLFLSPDGRAATRDALTSFLDRAELDAEARAVLWKALRDLIARHREFSDADWALPEDDLATFDAIAERVKPNDATSAADWLFALHTPDLGTGETRRGNWQAYNEALTQQRCSAIAAVESTEGFDAVRDVANRSAVPHAVGPALAQATEGKYDHQVWPLLGSTEASDIAFAGGFFWLRFTQGGWDLVSELLQKHADSAPVERARLLLATSDFPRAWEAAAEAGEGVGQAFWELWPTHGLPSDSPHLLDAGRRLLDAGRCAAALDFLAMHLHGSEDDPGFADLIVTALDALLALKQPDPELASLQQYDFHQLFGYLERHRDGVGPDAVARLEWAYLPALGFEPHTPALHAALAEDPNFFVEIMKVIYRAKGEEPADEPDERREALATNGYRLLRSWREVPGLNDGVVGDQELQNWVTAVLDSLKESGRRDAGESEVGHMLASAPPDPDGRWPSLAVRDLLERLQSDIVDEALRVEIYNRRGTTTRGPYDGGDQERALAAKYQAEATELADQWPRTAAVLRALAKGYEEDARRYDAEAEARKRGIH